MPFWTFSFRSASLETLLELSFALEKSRSDRPEVSRKAWKTCLVRNICFLFWTSSGISFLRLVILQWRAKNIRDNFPVCLCRLAASSFRSLTWRGHPSFHYQDSKRNMSSFFPGAELLICTKHSPTPTQEGEKNHKKILVRDQHTEVCGAYTNSTGGCLESWAPVVVFCLSAGTDHGQ